MKRYLAYNLNAFTQKTYDFFLGEAFVKINNYDEHLKARFLLKFCFFFLLFTLLLFPTILNLSLIALLPFGGVILTIIITPFLFRWKKNTTSASIILLFTAFIYVAFLHLITARPEGLAIFLWYIVIILSASFTLNKEWALIYVVLSLIMVGFLTYANHANLITYPVSRLGQTERLWTIPHRVGIPLCFIYLIAKQFVSDKEKAMSVTNGLLTYQKELNQTIENRKEYYLSILEEVGDIIYEINLQGKFSYINDAGTKLTGYTKEEIYEMAFDDCIVHEDKMKHRKQILEHLQAGKKESYSEFRIKTKTGEVVWIGQTSKFIYDDKGNYVNSFCVARNITKLLKEKKILQAAKEEAIRHNKAKDSFMAAVSHELRTPLNSVIALGYNLVENNPREDQKEDLDTMLYSSNILLNLINNILDFSIIEEGKLPIKNEGFDLVELLKQVMNGHIQQLKNEQLFIDLKIDKQIPTKLIGDASRLAQILNNLLHNAIKFTTEGEVSLEVKLNHIKDNKVKILFEIKDTGIGIAPSNQAIIFERFTQLDSSLSRNYGGTGIGLSIVKRILNRLDSQISVSSEVGQGTTFSFDLVFEEQIHQVPIVKKVDKTGLTGAKVLLVEDNKINQLVAKKLLLKWKIKVEIADNGKIGLEKVKENQYDIVLMDLEMPVMNGLEATKEIRVLAGLELPIIAVTATTSKEILNNFAEYQFTDIVSKPYKPTVLYQKMLLHYKKEISTPKIESSS